MKIVLASRNAGKVKEFNHAFENTGVTFESLDDIGFEEEIEEHAQTYEENALQKARVVSNISGRITVADDSGIEIDALPHELGVRTARYGAGKTPSEVNNEILDRLSVKIGDERACKYIAALAFVNPESGEFKLFRGVCEGSIHTAQVGENGFGFDPIFYLPELDKTMAQLTLEEKNKISHRAIAIKKLLKAII